MIEWTLESVVWVILLVDAVGANVVVYFGDDKWYKKHLRVFSRFFPLAKGWAGYYLVLVLWIGFMLYRSGQISF